MFGEEEMIVGYENPQIDLDLRAHDMRPTLRIKHDAKWDMPGETKAMDIPEMLKEWIPGYALEESKADSSSASVEVDAKWTPPGNLLKSYKSHGRQFEIWCSSLENERANEMLRGMRILIPMYIEGGTCNFLDDAEWSLRRWKIYFL